MLDNDDDLEFFDAPEEIEKTGKEDIDGEVYYDAQQGSDKDFASVENIPPQVATPQVKVRKEQQMVTHDARSITAAKQAAPRVEISRELQKILVGLKLTPQKILRMTETERKQTLKLKVSLKTHPDRGGSNKLYTEATEIFNNKEKLQQVVAALTNSPAIETSQKDHVKSIKNIATQETATKPKTKGTQRMGLDNQETTKKEQKTPHEMTDQERKDALGARLLKNAMSGSIKRTEGFIKDLKDLNDLKVDTIDINYKDSETGMTALNGAIHASDPEMVKLLLKNGATVNDRAQEDLKVLNDSPAQVAVIEAIENHNKPKEPTMIERMTAAKDAAKAMMFGNKKTEKKVEVLATQAQVTPKERHRPDPVSVVDGIDSPSNSPTVSPKQGNKKGFGIGG